MTTKTPQCPPANQSRREFLRTTGLGLGTLAGISAFGLPSLAQASATAFPSVPGTPETGLLAVPNQPYKEYVMDVGEGEVNPDGTPIKAITINGKLHGPEIRVTEGDLLRIVVKNNYSQPITSHWHGILLPNPMDGVPDVAQRPIYPGEVYVYQYLIRQTGTYWYHSHYNLQEQQGMAGSFIIEPKQETLQYDHEHTLFFSDWLHTDPYKVIPNLRAAGAKLPKMEMGKRPSKPDLADVEYPSFLLNGQGLNNPWIAKAKPGEVIRFRIINGGASTYFKFMIDGHDMSVVHVSGQAVKPVTVDNILIPMGERYDVLVKVKDSGQFGIRAIAQDGSGQALGELRTPDASGKVSKKIPKVTGKSLVFEDLQSTIPTTPPEGPIRKYSIDLVGDMRNYIWKMGDKAYPDADPLICKYGERVQVELVNKTNMYHPMHLHGHFARILTSNAPQTHLPLVDTFNVAPWQKVTLEFFADNPGRWIFHCHNLYHLLAGMARVVHYKV